MQALTIHFQSYVNKMTIILAVDPNVIPDPQRLFDDFEESLKLIREAVVKQGLNKETVWMGKLKSCWENLFFPLLTVMVLIYFKHFSWKST